jgi:4-hydroxybenzoate polyprenyltransferase
LSLPPRPEFGPDSEDEPVRQTRSAILPWLRLMRLPNVFTAIADVAMGYLFVQQGVTDAGKLACLVGASAALYTAGMVLNDVFDLAVDAKERPFRPLPSGQISLRAAKLLGWCLLLVGVGLGWLTGWLPGVAPALPWRSGVVASVLAACVVAYDGFLKNTPLGPLTMGACRFLNVLLGMSVADNAGAGGVLPGYGVGEWLAAAGIGTYIVGVTWFARSEAGESKGAILVAALGVMIAGVALLGASALFVQIRLEPQLFWLLLAVLMFTVLRRGGTAAIAPTPQKVQAAVKHSILSLIWLDAATAIVVAGPAYGIAIAALLIPALMLGRWVYST